MTETPEVDEEAEAACWGLALRVAGQDHDEVLAYLRARELVTDAYREAVLPLALEDGPEVPALAYVMRRDHWQYAGGLPAEEQARIIAQAHGGRGPNAEYLFNTAAHLDAMGVEDIDMAAAEAVAAKLVVAMYADVITSAGGILIIGIALKLLDLKDVKVGNFLPALVIAPLLAALVNAV